MTPNASELRMCQGAAGPLAVHLLGDPAAPAVVMTHSLLSASMMWEAQAETLAARGLHVVMIDLRGHGASPASPAPYTMDALADDSVAVLDALKIDRAHYVGLSIGAMSGFGLGIRHAERVLSLCLCDGRADSAPAAAAPWDERISTALAHSSCEPLAQPTIERWFGKPFLEAHPDISKRFARVGAATQVEGFVGCARAIQGMNYLDAVHRIGAPTTFIVGANDGVLPQAMQDLQALLPGAVLDIIPNAGHLPNIDQPQAFDAALARHFDRIQTL